MQIELIRTFLEIIEAGNFVKAAERLHVTQSTVSMRVKALEDSLGRKLFARSKSGIALTPAGHQFQHYAGMIQRLWQQARQDVGLPAQYRAVLSVGGQVSLWDRLLLHWLPWMRAAAPDVVLHAEVGQSDTLMANLVEGLIDIGVMYNPRPRPGLAVEKILEENLILVTTDRRQVRGAEPPRKGYVYVDWGPDLKRDHGEAYGDLEAPPISVGLGILGLHYILENGGSGYFPERVVGQLLADGQLHVMDRAPHFVRPAYMVFPILEQREDWFDLALEGLRYVAAREAEPHRS